MPGTAGGVGGRQVAASLRAAPDQTNGLVGDQARDWSYEPFFDVLPVPTPAIA